jgi:Domain of unknown function (DUF4249)
MRFFRNTTLFLVNLLIWCRCTDPYQPPALQQSYKYLILDGFLDADTDSTKFTLRRTETIANPATTILEPYAYMQIEEEVTPDALYLYPLISHLDGTYTVDPGFGMVVDLSKRYRIHIWTNDNKEYISDFAPVKKSPAIDSISFKKTNSSLQDGLQVYANTHDSENSTHYYLWTYDETWKYQSRFESGFVKVPGDIIRRQDQIFRCYQTVSSSTILINSTTGLNRDLVSEFPLTFIPFVSPRLSYRYSINVQQYALTEEAYSYWNTLKKNTEGLGTLFGPLPSQSVGNLKCVTNPNEPILGFFMASSKETKRIFIDSASFEIPHQFDNGYQDCQQYRVPLQEALTYPTTDLFLFGIYQGIDLVAYEASSAYCSDCRLQGGTTKRPSFWTKY